MTTSSATVRPYRVFVDALYLPDSPIVGSTTTKVIDGGLAHSELDEIRRPEVRSRLIWIDLSGSIWPFILDVFLLAIGWFTFAAQPITGAATFLAGAGVIVAHIYAIRFGIRLRSETNDARGQLLAYGRIAYYSTQGGATLDQLSRIDKAIRALQARDGSAHDDKAREAVAAVLRQDKHEPTKRQLGIADSTANDADSIAIRTRALAAKAAWSGDVARAEHLVIALEDSAAGKAPSKV
jgi:hypothetical protein